MHIYTFWNRYKYAEIFEGSYDAVKYCLAVLKQSSKFISISLET